MLEDDKNIQNLETSELTIDDVNHSETKRALNSVISKISDTDVEQVKIYLGVVYFVALSLVTLTLFL